ncbi:MAG: hypothetical protein FWC54_01045, partial [Actinomycetia bacterium]|nr:hypothetical protein [Actinomycetes bacterium]
MPALIALVLMFPFQVSLSSPAFATSVSAGAPTPAAPAAQPVAESVDATPSAAAPAADADKPAAAPALSKVAPLNIPIAPTAAALPFEVSGDLNDSYNTLADAITAINSDAGSDYTITAGQDDTITNLDIDKNVLLTSESGVTATLTNTVGARHFQISAGGSLTLEDITLQGTTQTTGNTPAGGINVLAQGSLTLESGATIQGVHPASAATSYAQGAAVQCAGTFTMNGGLITDNRFAY